MRTAAAILLTFFALLAGFVCLSAMSLFGGRPVTILLLIASGVVIFLPKLWQEWDGWFKNIAAAVGIVVCELIVLELLLALTGSPVVSRAAAESLIIQDFNCLYPQGCHFNPEQIAMLQAQRDLTSTAPSQRPFIMNAQGVHDSDPFSPDAVPTGNYRILASGDSFTVGYTAEIGRSYIETVESRTPNLTLWNAAFPATGMRHLLASLRYYAPIMQPDLLFAAINQNDLQATLYPIDQFLQVNDPLSGVSRWVERYGIDDALQVRLLDDTSMRYRFFDVDGVSLTDFNQMFLNTRTGYQLYTVLARFRAAQLVYSRDDYQEVSFDAMREQLSQLKALARRLDLPLLTLVIPVEEAIDETLDEEGDYAHLLALLSELGIPYLDPLPLLTHDDYRNASPSDPHWNTAGHEKVGAMVADCITYMIENNGSLCPDAV